VTAPTPGLRTDRPWDVITRTIDGPRLLGAPIAQVAAVVILGAGCFLSAAVATGRDVVPSLAVAAAGAVLTGVLAAAANAYARPLSSRRAFEAFVYLGEAELDRVARLEGGTVKPTIPGMERYLASAPERAEDRWIRVEFLGKSGDLDGAQAMALRMPEATPFDRLERAAALVWVDWLGGGPGDPTELRSLVRDVEPVDSDARRRAEVVVACAELRARVARGSDDPAAPLAAVRERLGPHADDVLLRMTWRVLPAMIRTAGLLVAVLLVIARLSSG
jgi:hypothetical protein